MILFLVNNIKRGTSSIMDDRYVKLGDNKKILYFDANILYGHSMSQPLPCDKMEMWHGHPDLYMNNLEEIKNAPDDSDIGYFVKVDLRYPDYIKEKMKNFLFCPENKVVHKDKFNDYMQKIKFKNYAKVKKLLCDWIDKILFISL